MTFSPESMSDNFALILRQSAPIYEMLWLQIGKQGHSTVIHMREIVVLFRIRVVCVLLAGIHDITNTIELVSV